MADVLTLGIGVDVRGRLLSELEGLQERYRDPKPLAYAVAKLLRASFAKNIDEGGRPKWQPLAASTLVSKALKGYPSKPLVATGALRTAVGQRNARGNVTYVAADGTLKVGVNLPYAKWQNNGTAPHVIVPRGKKALAFSSANGKVVVKRVNHPGIPARPFLVIQPEDYKAIRSLLKEWAAGDLPPGDE